MTVLITNDDGDCEGIRMLREAAMKLDDEVYVIAPDKQQSAVSGALTLHKPLRLHKLEKDVFTLNGTPADCVLFALYSGEFKKPDLVLSGINWGDNTGLASLISSGTLGACWQAVLEGIPAIAFSRHTTNRNWRDKGGWGDRKKTVKIAADIIKKLTPKLTPERFFSVNMPDDLSAPKTIFTNHFYGKRYRARITKRFDPNSQPYFWMTGGPEENGEGTDYYEVKTNKNIAISEVSLSLFEGV